MRTVLLAHEQEGPALIAGAWLGGERAALLMQSSGVGNTVAALSLIRTCRFPFLSIVTMRGEWGETNPWQLPMGLGTAPHLEQCGVASTAWTTRRRRVRDHRRRRRADLRERRRNRGPHRPARDRREELRRMTGRAQPETSLDRRTAVAVCCSLGRDDVLVVPGLGSATWDCAALGDNPLHFSLWGAMGNASMIGLGLALAQPARRVLVLTGDGDMLMGLGSLATIATQAPANLALVVLDNERHGETGMQLTHHGAPHRPRRRRCGLRLRRGAAGRGRGRPPRRAAAGARGAGADLSHGQGRGPAAAPRPPAPRRRLTSRIASAPRCWAPTPPSDLPLPPFPPLPC